MQDAAKYRCPICQATYEHELLTRVHLTRVDDDNHATHNGLMPEAEIEVLDADGDVLEAVTRSAADLDPTILTEADLPAALSEKRRHAVLVAAHNPYERSARAVTDCIAEQADQTDLAVPGYRTVCRALTSFYQPDDDEPDTNDESLSELTAKQQAIVVAQLADPDASDRRIANQVGCAESYPRQVTQRAGHILDRLRADRDAGRALTAILADELTAGDCRTLRERELLKAVSVQLPALEAEQDETAAAAETTHNTDAEAADSGAGTSGDDPETATPVGQWGSPVENATGIRAEPADPFSETTEAATTTASTPGRASVETAEGQHADSETAAHGAESDAPNDADSDGDDNNDASSQSDASLQGRRQTPEIERLHQQVTFMIEVFDRLEDSDPTTKRMLALATQVREECVALLPTEGDV